MVKRKSVVYNYYTIKEKDNKVTASCKFCSKSYLKHATRMLKHIRDCQKCPDKVKKLFIEQKKSVLNFKSDSAEPPIEHNNNMNMEVAYTEPTVVSETNQQKFVSPSTSSTGLGSSVNTTSTYTRKRKAQTSGNTLIHSFLDTCNKETKEQIDEALARAIFTGSISLRYVENHHLRHFFKLMRPAYTAPGRTALSTTLLEKEYNLIKQCIENKIADATSMTLLSDGWTDINGISLINILLATPDPIFVKAIDSGIEKHTAQYIFTIFDQIIQEYGENKIHAVCTDNAPTMKAVWELLQADYPKLLTYGCAAHSFNLLAKDIGRTNYFSKTAAIAKKVIQFYKNKHLPKQVLKKIQIDQIGKEIALITAVETRWSSLHHSFESLIKNKDFIQASVFDKNIVNMQDLKNIKNSLLSDTFWTKLQNCTNILKPISEAIALIEGDKYATMPHVYPAFKGVEEMILETVKLLPEEDKKKISNSVKERKEFLLYDVHLAAYLLDPKQRGQNLNDEEIATTMEFIVNFAKNMDLNGEDVLKDLINYNGKSEFWNKSLLWTIPESISSVNWWKGFCKNKVLTKVAVRILSFPASSASCERTWKDFSNIKTKKRNRLSIKRTEKLVFIKYNLKLLTTEDLQNAKEFLKEKGERESELTQETEFEEINEEEESNESDETESVISINSDVLNSSDDVPDDDDYNDCIENTSESQSIQMQTDNAELLQEIPNFSAGDKDEINETVNETQYEDETENTEEYQNPKILYVQDYFVLN